MYKTTFLIAKMDCPSEERMIRLQLQNLSNIVTLAFDIPNRKVEVYHTDGYDLIFQALNCLQLEASLLETQTIHDFSDFSLNDKTAIERRLLWQVLAINFSFFLLETLMGFIAGSMGLVADSLDMLADSFVYGLSLLAVGGSMVQKKQAAKASGYLQLLLAILGLIEVIRRFLGYGEVPVFQLMIIISILALIGNSLCLYLLQKSKNREAHIQASMIFTSNDVIINISVIIAGILTFLTRSKLPDLIIGMIVFIIVGRGAYRILQLAK